MLTPLTKTDSLAQSLNLPNNLFLKREDLHPLGSHKGRSIPIMIEKRLQEGWRDFVISSSGNAALAASIFVRQYNQTHSDKIKLQIFLGENINKNKKVQVERYVSSKNKMITIKQVKNPKQAAFKMEKEGKGKFLRQSTDEYALIGYYELAKELKEAKTVFIPTSSGTTAQGLYEGFQKLKLNPQIHIVQTEACHPFVVTKKTTHVSIASAIVDKIAHRKQKVLDAIKNSRGAGWVASDDQIKEAMELVKKTEGLKISPNSALSVAGLKLALENGWKFEGSVVCLITGA